jgi:hypothetical protein
MNTPLQLVRQDDVAWLDNEVRQRYLARGERSDADILSTGTGYFFQRQLNSIFAETLQADVAPPNFMRLFSIDTSVAEGAKSYTQRLQEPVGEAIIIANWGNDLPRVNTTRKEETRGIKYIGDSYSYSVQDIMAARFAGEPLDRDLGVSAREAIERKHNDLCWFGDDEHDLWGVLRHPYIPQYNFTEPISAAASSADAIIDEINSMINGVNTLTEQNAQVDTLVLPPDEYSYIFSTPRSTTSDTTIGEYILMNNAYFRGGRGRIEQAWELQASLNGGQARCLAYRNDPRNVKYVAPLAFRQLPVERRNLEFVINNIGQSGGFYTPKPLHMVKGNLA